MYGSRAMHARSCIAAVGAGFEPAQVLASVAFDRESGFVGALLVRSVHPDEFIGAAPVFDYIRQKQSR